MNRASNRIVAARMAGIEPFHVMEIQERAHRLEAQGRHIVHMEIGQPDFAAPPQVIEAAIDAMRTRSLGYTSSLGLPELREAIAKFYGERYGVAVPPERIIVTVGGSGAFLLALGVLAGAGDEVLMSDPCYPCNRHFVRLFDARPVTVPVDEQRNFQLTAADVRQHWRAGTRGVLLASPSNPTGTTIAAPELGAIIEEVRGRNGFVVVDEIYLGLTYGEKFTTALSLSERIFVVNSFSKYFNMTGWRLGWMVAPESYLRDVEKLAQNLFICPPAPAQYGALAAFRPDALALLEERRREFQQRRDYLVPALRALGFSVPIMPQGAFYIYAGMERFGPDSHEFALEILDRAGVALTPGLDFGNHRPERFVRIAYTRALADLQEGIQRLSDVLGV